MHSATATSSVLTERVLVIDDDVSFHRLAEAALAEAGINCVCVRSGEEAQRLMIGSKPRAIIVDGLLPGVRGDELARRVRQNYSRGAMPIIFVSAFYRDMKSYKLLTQDCGVDLVLHKPVTLQQLRGAVEKVLKQVAFPVAQIALPPANEPVRNEVVRSTAAHAQAAATDDDVELLVEPDDDDDGDELLGGAGPEMLQLRVEYLSASRERVQELRAALASLGSAQAEDALHRIRVEAHRFRGSGASFGYPEISRLGGAVEDLILENDFVLRSGQVVARLTGLVEALADKVLAIAGSAPILAERKVGAALRRLLLVDAGDSALSARAHAANEKNQPIDATDDLDQALRSAIELRPDAIFVSAAMATSGAIQRIRAGSPAPVVVLGEKDSLEDWLGALRAGAVGYVARPPDVESLFRLGAFYARPRLTANLLAVGGDRGSLSTLAETLAPKGLAVQPCATTEEFFASLERAAPSMVILDGDLPGARAIDLLRVLRADVNYRRVPVTVVSRMGDMKDRIAAYEAGADDWMVRPVPPEELAVRIFAQLARAGADPLVRRDALTGLYDRDYLLEACTRALQLGRRDGRQVALLGIDLGLDGLRREKGRLAADEALMALGTRLLDSFRTSDVVARVGPSRLVALLHGAGKADAERLLRVELEALAEQSVAGGWKLEPKGAIAVFPEVMGGADALFAAVEAQLAR